MFLSLTKMMEDMMLISEPFDTLRQSFSRGDNLGLP